MSNAKESIPKGTRDFLPAEMALRQAMVQTIRGIYELYGYGPMETPAFEYLETLTDKGGEGIKNQIYHFKDKAERELGLRFDLTVPFARVVSAYGQALTLPFKRYQISRVWRYEAPQRGRLREFWQADADIAGCASVNAEAELLAMGVKALEALGLQNFYISLNNRKILASLLRQAQITAAESAVVMRILDKLDKIGREGVREEMQKKGIPQTDALLATLVSATLATQGSATLDALKKLSLDEEGILGLNELEQVLHQAKDYGYAQRMVLDPTMVRGLDYYTGPIFEFKASAGDFTGSIAGGGRYDQLIQRGRETIPAVGLSLGIERLAEVLKNSRPDPASHTQIFIVPFSEDFRAPAIATAEKLRQRGVRTEISLTPGKVGKRLGYANDQKIPFTLVIGEAEVASQHYPFKDMAAGTVEKISLDDIVKRVPPRPTS